MRLPMPENQGTRMELSPRAHTKTEAVRAKLLARELMPSLPIWNAGDGCLEIWALPM